MKQISLHPRRRIYRLAPNHTNIALSFAFMVMLSLAGCADLTGNAPLPSGIVNPEMYETPDGAMLMARSVVNQAADAFSRTAVMGGILTDEIEHNVAMAYSTYVSPVALRNLPQAQKGLDESSYNKLQGIRNASAYAIVALRKWAPLAPATLSGEMYALQGYAEILLADLFCSGVPLSVLNFEGGYTYRKGSTTSEVYRHADALFDTAIALSKDSLQILSLARLGKGRALMALGEYATAKTAVAEVPVNFVYSIPVLMLFRNANNTVNTRAFSSNYITASVADREGGNGFPFVTGRDPRTPVELVLLSSYRNIYIPKKYAVTTPVPLVIANGVEARLIQAETELKAGESGWITTLNTLRTNNMVTTTPRMDGGVDSVWSAGTGGVAGLRPLERPESDTASVSMIFRERAAWLFLTGHRQGDLRRLVRNYRRNQQTVYPTGQYVGTTSLYGADVNLPIDPDEDVNPLWKGCYDRNA